MINTKTLTMIDLNVTGLEFPVIECRYFEDARKDLKDRISKAMDRKTFGVSGQSLVWDSCYDWNYKVRYLPESRTQGRKTPAYRKNGRTQRSHRQYFISKSHQAPHITAQFMVECQVMEINGEQFTSTKELKSVEKSVQTVYANWRQAWAHAFDRGADILDEICERGKYAPESEVA